MTIHSLNCPCDLQLIVKWILSKTSVPSSEFSTIKLSEYFIFQSNRSELPNTNKALFYINIDVNFGFINRYGFINYKSLTSKQHAAGDFRIISQFHYQYTARNSELSNCSL